MKFKLGEIRTLESSLAKLMNKELPIKAAYRLGKLLKAVSEELTIIENNRVKLIKKYSKGEDESGNFEVIKEKVDDFKKEFADFLTEEVEIDCKPVSISELGDISLAPIDLIRLDKLICDE